MRIHPLLWLSLSTIVTACVASEPASTSMVSPSETGTRERPDLIECRTDDACPRGSYCEPGLNICFTGSRCIVNGRPSDAFCERTYGEDFTCFEYAIDSFHCVPTE